MNNQVSQGIQTTETPQKLAERLGLPVSNYSLLTRALTHRSYLNEHPEAIEDNERLEFLGDAVLDFLVGAWLYNHFPEMAEGELTRLRSALVRREQLSQFAERIDLGSALRLGRGESEGGGRKRQTMLCGAFEALIGAIYLDAGMISVQQFMENFLEGATDQILAMRKDHDPKSILQEWVQSKGFGPPSYRVITTSGPEHQKTFEVEVIINGTTVAKGVGHSKQQAAKEAANEALAILGVI